MVRGRISALLRQGVKVSGGTATTAHRGRDRVTRRSRIQVLQWDSHVELVYQVNLFAMWAYAVLRSVSAAEGETIAAQRVKASSVTALAVQLAIRACHKRQQALSAMRVEAVDRSVAEPARSDYAAQALDSVVAEAITAPVVSRRDANRALVIAISVLRDLCALFKTAHRPSQE